MFLCFLEPWGRTCASLEQSEEPSSGWCWRRILFTNRKDWQLHNGHCKRKKVWGGCGAILKRRGNKQQLVLVGEIDHAPIGVTRSCVYDCLPGLVDGLWKVGQMTWLYCFGNTSIACNTKWSCTHENKFWRPLEHKMTCLVYVDDGLLALKLGPMATCSCATTSNMYPCT